MKSLALAVTALLSLPVAALSLHPPIYPNHCVALGAPADNVYAVPNQVLQLPVWGTLCIVMNVWTTTPSLISIEETGSPRGFTSISSVTVRALAPGIGELHFRATTGQEFMATVFVDDCGEGSHVVTLPRIVSANPRQVLQLNAEAHGIFNRGFKWFINGLQVGWEQSLTYTTSDPGVFDLEVRGESECGVVSAHSALIVGRTRARGVRH